MFDYIVDSEMRYEWAWLIMRGFARFKFKLLHTFDHPMDATVLNSTRALFTTFETLPADANEI